MIVTKSKPSLNQSRFDLGPKPNKEKTELNLKTRKETGLNRQLILKQDYKLV